MKWSELRRGDVFASKRSDKVRLVLNVDVGDPIITLEFWSITSERHGETVFGTEAEINPDHYEVYLAGEGA